LRGTQGEERVNGCSASVYIREKAFYSSCIQEFSREADDIVGAEDHSAASAGFNLAGDARPGPGFNFYGFEESGFSA
jgi:hypothetical protein